MAVSRQLEEQATQMRELSSLLLGKGQDAQPDAAARHLKAAPVLAEGRARQRSRKHVRDSASGFPRPTDGILPLAHRASLQPAPEMPENVTGRRDAKAATGGASAGIDEAVLLTTRPQSAYTGAETKSGVTRASTQSVHADASVPDGEHRATLIYSHRPYDTDIIRVGTASRSSAYEMSRTRSSEATRDSYVSRR